MAIRCSDSSTELGGSKSHNMKTLLITAVLFCAVSTLGQGVEVVTGNQLLSTRQSLERVTANYALEANGTNAAMTQVSFTVRIDQKIGAGDYVKVSETSYTLTKAGVEAWVLTYTNNQDVVVTNNIRTATLTDLDRLNLLPTRVVQFIRTPQAMVAIGGE